MVTETKVKQSPSVIEVGRSLGIPVELRPWWGSRRVLYRRRHLKCGHTVWQESSGGFWCSHCSCHVELGETDLIRMKPGHWVCPAGYSQELKWPRVEGDKVVMWEGRCGARYEAAQRARYGSEIHIHRQVLEVLDFSNVAMLVRVSVNSHCLNFLIGRDDGHPFVHVVTKSQVTVSDAYDYLVPVPVFNAQMHGFDVKRQGDFFFVPREFWAHPRPIKNEERRLRRWPGRVDARSTAEMGCIYSKAPIMGTRHIAERLIATFPYQLVKGVVTAPDHPPVQLDTWHCAVSNIRPCAVNPDTTAGYGD